MKKENISSIEKLTKEILHKHKTDELKVDYSNVISIVGDRGFGKTSTLRESLDTLKENQNLIVCDIIDPLAIMKVENKSQNSKSNYGLKEIILSLILNEIKKSENKEKNTDKLINMLNELAEILVEDYKTNDDIYLGGTNILEKIANLESADKKMQAIVDLFIETIGGVDGLVIPVDDFDLLDSSIIHNVINDLQELMHIKRIVFIICYRSTQLIENITISNLEKYDAGIKNNIVTVGEISNQSYRTVEKIFEKSKSVILPRIEEIYEMEYNKFNDDTMNNSEGTVKKNLEKMIKEVVLFDICPYLADESTNFFLPQNIRGIVQLIEELEKMISEMKKYDYESQEYYSIAIATNKRFYEYVFNQYNELARDIDLKNIVKNYYHSESELKSWSIISGIRNYCRTNASISNIILNTNKNSSCYRFFNRDAKNTSLGDLIETIDELKLYSSNNDVMRFIYIIKVMYSLDITRALLEMKNEYINNDCDDQIKLNSFKNYQNLVGLYPIPMQKKNFGINWKSTLTFEDFFNDECYNHERYIFLYNLVTPVNNGDKINDNQSYLADFNGKSISNNVRLQNKLYLRSFEPLLREKCEEIIISKNKNALSEYLRNYNYNLKDTFNYIVNPYVFMLREEYIKYSFTNDYFVIKDLFTIDYINGINTWRASEEKPLKKFYSMLNERMFTSNDEYSENLPEGENDKLTQSSTENISPNKENRDITNLHGNIIDSKGKNLFMRFFNTQSHEEKNNARTLINNNNDSDKSQNYVDTLSMAEVRLLGKYFSINGYNKRQKKTIIKELKNAHIPEGENEGQLFNTNDKKYISSLINQLKENSGKY